LQNWKPQNLNVSSRSPKNRLQIDNWMKFPRPWGKTLWSKNLNVG